jgi:hypothetical protein
MKRIFTILSAAIIMCLVQYSPVSGQEKKSEQKIKIVIDDGSGTKVVLDTLIKDGIMKDSITMKDGKVIFTGHSGDDAIMKTHGGNEHVFVTISSDAGEDRKEVREITVVSSDSLTLKESGKQSKVYLYSDNKESSDEKTRYVIAKDGMVVTVEGSDEAKVKELIKEIEKKLEVKK